MCGVHSKIKMARRKTKKKKQLRAVKLVKELSRERIGTVPAEKVVPDRKKKRKDSEKHKPTLEDLLSNE